MTLGVESRAAAAAKARDLEPPEGGAVVEAPT
jgi:hypothetical protein